MESKYSDAEEKLRVIRKRIDDALASLEEGVKNHKAAHALLGHVSENITFNTEEVVDKLNEQIAAIEAVLNAERQTPCQ